MSKRFHSYSYGESIWIGYGDDKRSFDAKDVTDVRVEQKEGTGGYYVGVHLKNGEIICPDYSTYWDRIQAAREATFWRSILKATAEDAPVKEQDDSLIYENDNLTGFCPEELNADTDSPMSAVEVLKWLGIHYRDEEYTEAFGSDYKFTELLRPEFSSFTSQEIVDKITAYEAAKKAPKPVEKGYYCKIYKQDGEIVADYVLWDVTEKAAKGDVIDKAIDYTSKNGEQVKTDVKFTCRVKEGES